MKILVLQSNVGDFLFDVFAIILCSTRKTTSHEKSTARIC